jgi:hypothetical protein
MTYLGSQASACGMLGAEQTWLDQVITWQCLGAASVGRFFRHRAYGAAFLSAPRYGPRA